MALSGYTVRPAAPPETHPMSTAALVLGLAGLPALLLCGAGVPLALTGLVLAIIALRRRQGGRQGRQVAIAGIVACITTVAAGAALITWLLVHAAACGDRSRYPDDPSRERCIEQEFPFAGSASQH